MSYYYEPFYNFDRFFDEAFSPRNAQRRLGSGGEGDTQNPSVVQSIKPRMDLHEDGQTNTVTATFELPGLKKDDVNIDIHDGRLTVSGETKISSDHEENGYAIRERRFGRFARTLQLPKGVKVSFVFMKWLNVNDADAVAIGRGNKSLVGGRRAYCHLSQVWEGG
ncbi:hypothetical protein PM082_021640 [Marasmius tenuissimus]|nr:hypothetical protein PM082_021640 [Marasmius tenuissimus]